MFKYLISNFLVFIMLCSGFSVKVEAKSFVSLVPAVTEIMYKIGAQDNLVGVSTACNYPESTKNKVKIGDTFFLNKEQIIQINPDYILALDTSKPLLGDFKKTSIKPVFFEFKNVDDIYFNIIKLGALTSREDKAQKLVNEIKSKVKKNKTKKPKKILYLVQPDPMISVGSKSFISDVILKSGQISITSSINDYYPAISAEFAMKSKPDIIIVSFYSNISRLRKIFPDTKIIFLTKKQQDIINRPGPRVYEAIKYFSLL